MCIYAVEVTFGGKGSCSVWSTVVSGILALYDALRPYNHKIQSDTSIKLSIKCSLLFWVNI